MTDQGLTGKGKSPIVRLAGKYGLISAVSLILGLGIIYYAGKHPLLINIVFDLRILIFALFIFIGIREYRQDYNNGILHFWQGLYIGIILYITAAFITSLFIWIFAGWLDVDFLTSFIAKSMETLETNKQVIIESLGERNFNAAMEGLPTTTAGNLAFDYFLKSMPIGFILTLVISMLLRRRV